MADSLLTDVAEVLLPDPPPHLGVAVSGGGDSVALLHLLRDFCQTHDILLRAVTVDHGLRAESAAEAAQVSALCASIGVPHDTLVWSDWNGEGNLQGAARNARYGKIAEWARLHKIDTVCIGHTADDQAETFLLRLARRSGVDGLAAMQTRTVRDGINWLRPLLHTRRDHLRSYLRQRGLSWIDDPSNEDTRFDRIKARQALKVLAPLGIDTDALCEVADHMHKSRRALDWQTFLVAKKIITIKAGAVVLDEGLLKLQPDEIQRRLFIRAINWVSGSSYPPRRGALASVMAGLRKGQAGTLDGCHIRRIGTSIWVFREHNAVRSVRSEIDAPWDGRWIFHHNWGQRPNRHLSLRALGQEGLEQCPNWRDTGHPYIVLQSTPAVWSGAELVAAPLAGYAQYWGAELRFGPDTFFAALLSH